MSTSPLCLLPPPEPSACGCSSPALAPSQPLVPLPIDNPPGLAAIPYRIGTFTSFRQAMLTDVADPALLGAAPNPFAAWHPGTDGDYQTRLLELWAYLADILTFYQERIANEAYLGTATQLDSAIRLAQLIAYQPSPGSAASGLAAFNATAGKLATLAAGFRIGARAQSGKPATVFELSSGLTVRPEHNAIPLSSVWPTNQFALLTSFQAVFDGTESLAQLLAAAGDIFATAGSTFVDSFPHRSYASAAVLEQARSFAFAAPAQTARVAPHIARAAAAAPLHPRAALLSTALLGQSVAVKALGSPVSSSLSGKLNLASGIDTIGPTLYTGVFAGTNIPVVDTGIGYAQVPRYTNQSTRSILLTGVGLRLFVGDHVLAVDSASPPVSLVYHLDSVVLDKAANTTTVTWQEAAGQVYAAPVQLYALRVKASAFGSSAPAWISLSPALNGNDPVGSPPSWPAPAAYSTQQPWPAQPSTTMVTPYSNYDDPNAAEFYLPFLGDASSIYLDGAYESVRGTRQTPGYLVLLDGRNTLPPRVLTFTDAAAVTAVGYSLSSKVTRLTLASGSSFPAYTYGIRTTVVLCGAEQLLIEPDLPLPDLLEGSSLILAGLYPNLLSGQAVVLQGLLFAAPNAPSAEPHTLFSQPTLDPANNLTTVTLDSPLTAQYSRASTVLLANIAPFTHGETVKDEILGSGNGQPSQSFPLAKKPLTYLPSTDPQSLSPVASTLRVTVGGVQWQQQPQLTLSTADAPVYTLSQDAAQQSRVQFGNGLHGAVPPTGVANVHARYRVGLGLQGNVPAAAVAQLVDGAPGVSRVANPIPTVGGSDPESVAQTRLNAPASVRAFGRAVSEADYASLALTFPGVAKATATTVTVDANGNALPQPYVQLTIGTSDQSAQNTALAARLRTFLDQRRDPNIPLRIAGLTPVFIDVSLTLDILPTYPRQGTVAAVLAALNPSANADGSFGYFSFARLDFGQSLYLSAVYALVQAVPGVTDLTITRFQVAGNAATLTPSDITIGPTQIAAIDNDPANPQNGQLILTPGLGGYADA
ncbi:MAG TPA: putative baseplate assembly protein [Acidobacteriaceae bacterium]